MATGVKPRDEESAFTRSDLEAIQDAMKTQKFREMLSEYCEEIRDPANQAIYQKEMTQLEKERGYDVTFINPKGSYVIKTSVAGDRKAFINICSNDNVGKPSYNIKEANGKRGMNWQIPYSIIPPREDYDTKRERCVIYDVVFHPDTLRMAQVNKQFRELVNKSAVDGLQNAYNIHFDCNNFRFPKSYYKGITMPAVIRKEDPNFKPPEDGDDEELSAEVLEKLYPQQLYPEKSIKQEQVSQNDAPSNLTVNKCTKEFTHSSESGYTIPKYVIKQQKNVDLQDFTYHRDSKQYSAIPSHIVVEINLPLLSSTKDCSLDVNEKSLSLLSEKPAKYRLTISLPYSVNDECGNAKFDKSKRMLIVTLPVIRKNLNGNVNYLRADSGVESEENSGSQSEEENNNNLVVELSSITHDTTLQPTDTTEFSRRPDNFLEADLGYMLPPYTYNAMDDIIAFTFHVKNTEPDSVKVKNIDSTIHIKFTSIGSGFVPVHYAAVIIFDKSIKFSEVNGEAWDNNVILQLELDGDAPQKFQIGINLNSMVSEYLDFSQVKKAPKPIVENQNVEDDEVITPVVEVTNLGSETNIVVSSNHIDYEDDSEEYKEKKIVWIENHCENEAKSILRKPISMMRSYSESSAGDVASSMDYISSDCIPEESSLKKTVRFNDVIARQFYRYNSSIEGQKKKNQRKKSKKRSQERRKSESEAEEETRSSSQPSPTRLKSALKQRRDSGLADTSDAETEYKSESFTTNEDKPKSTNISAHSSMLDIVNNEAKVKAKSETDIWETDGKPKKDRKYDHTSENIKHNTQLYDPDRLNKGQYLEVMFKNDLIFDLDM